MRLKRDAKYIGKEFCRMKAPGRGFLLVCGILHIIFSVIALVLLLATSASIDSIRINIWDAGVSITQIIINVIFVIIQLIAGIIFVANYNKPASANLCLVFAVIAIIVPIINVILNGFNWTDVPSFVLPILCLIGAIKNKNADTTATVG